MPGTPLGTSQSVLPNASYYKERVYIHCIWFRGGDLNGFSDFLDFKNWLGLGMSLGQPLSPEFQISNFLAKLYINIYYIKKSEVSEK